MERGVAMECPVCLQPIREDEAVLIAERRKLLENHAAFSPGQNKLVGLLLFAAFLLVGWLFGFVDSQSPRLSVRLIVAWGAIIGGAFWLVNVQRRSHQEEKRKRDDSTASALAAI